MPYLRRQQTPANNSLWSSSQDLSQVELRSPKMPIMFFLSTDLMTNHKQQPSFYSSSTHVLNYLTQAAEWSEVERHQSLVHGSRGGGGFVPHTETMSHSYMGMVKPGVCKELDDMRHLYHGKQLRADRLWSDPDWSIRINKNYIWKHLDSTIAHNQV